MTIEEAISQAKDYYIVYSLSPCGQTHAQLAEWLEELVALRKRCADLERALLTWQRRGAVLRYRNGADITPDLDEDYTYYVRRGRIAPIDEVTLP